MRNRTMLATALSALAMPALAAPVQQVDGPYIDLGAGYNLLQDVFTHPRLAPQNQPAARTRFGEGFVTAGALGWGFGNGRAPRSRAPTTTTPRSTACTAPCRPARTATRAPTACSPTCSTTST